MSMGCRKVLVGEVGALWKLHINLVASECIWLRQSVKVWVDLGLPSSELLTIGKATFLDR